MAIYDTTTTEVNNWWNNLSEEEQKSLEIDYGYYGHDEGLTEDDIVYMFICENM